MGKITGIPEVADLRLPGAGDPALSNSRRPPRHVAGENFLKGALSWDWLCRAARQMGRALQLAILLCFWSALTGRSTVVLSRRKREFLGTLSKESGRRALDALTRAGLVSVTHHPGRAPVVKLLGDPGHVEPRSHYLRGPVPWKWLQRAAAAPARALHVALALWFTAGRENAREFVFVVANLTELGLNRYAAYRGLAALQAAGLIEVPPHNGRHPKVKLVEAQPSIRRLG